MNLQLIKSEPNTTMRPLADVLDALHGVKVKYSSDRYSSDEKQTPFLKFEATNAIALAIHKELSHEEQMHRGQNYIWQINGNFSEDGLIEWTIEPNDKRFHENNTNWRANQVEHDVALLGDAIAKMNPQYFNRKDGMNKNSTNAF